jgi:hypothetical protein
MSLQTIIDNAQFITIDSRKVIGQTISRSGRIKSAEVISAVPYRLTVGMHSGLKYSENRALLQDLATADRNVESTIDIGSTNTGLSYVTAYQGDSTGIAGVTCVSASGNTLTVNASAAGTGTYLFKKGDFIQPGTSYRYPYQVTADVAHTTSSSVAVSIHRPFIEQSGYTLSGKSLLSGTNVTFRVIMLKKPSFSVVPHDRIEFDTDFDLLEVIE